ncbi:ribonuclease H-like domain-containing protein, partial [Tanacetum coccineum]
NALADLGASVNVMPLSTYINLGLGELAYTKLTVELADRIVKHPKGISENVLVGIELRDNTFSGSEHEDANEHIEKVLEIVDLFHIPKVTQDQIMLRAFPDAIPSKTADDAKIAIQEMAEYSQKWHNETSSRTRSTETFDMSKVLQERGFGSLPSSTETNPQDQVKSISTGKADFSKMRRIGHEPYAVSGTQHISLFSKTVPFPGRLQNFGCDDWREARDVKILDAYDHTLPQKEKVLGSFTLPCFIHNIYFDKALVDLEVSVCVMPFSTYTNLGLGILSHTRLTIELADQTIKQPRGIAKNVLVRIGKFIFPIDFIILDIPEDNDVPLILERPFFSTAHSKIDVFKRKITLRVGEEKLVFKSVKPATNIIKRVFVIKSLDSKTNFIRVGDESFDLIYGGYIELNDLDTPLETKTDRDDGFVPIFVKTGSYMMEFSCVIGYKYINADLLPSLPINLNGNQIPFKLIVKKKLKTQDMLRNWDANLGNVCSLCETQPDSLEHLFFECPFSQVVWSHMKVYAGLDASAHDLYLIISNFLSLAKRKASRSVIAKLVVSASAYFLWQERNGRLFKKHKRSSTQIIECITTAVRLNLLSVKI